MQAFAHEDEVYEFLNRFLNFERAIVPTAYRLDRMEALKTLYGKPDEAYAIAHVAGSKGKGSTATMLASILEDGKDPVGLYTSPHLLHFTERIALDGVPVGRDILLAAAEELRAGMEGKAPEDFPGGETPTYFELLTMLGFLCFRRAGCSKAVIEVGLGGRLDSTNVVKPMACLITPIELEHTELLGDTIAKIAAEKAGIIKPGVPVYTSATRPEALAVIRQTAQSRGSPLRVLDEEVRISGLRITAEGTAFSLSFSDQRLHGGTLELRTPLIGEVQARNAALAALTALDLGISPERVREGLAKASLRARFEVMPGDPIVVLDGAHTPDSAAACARDFLTLFKGGGVLLFGCAKDKDPSSMAMALKGVADSLIVTKPGTFKESEPERIAEAFRKEGYGAEVEEDTARAIALALEKAMKEGKPLLVTGSFYLCAEAAKLLAERGRGAKA
jgi:dihydrofolate synthase/folylpolyglutamate synthase